MRGVDAKPRRYAVAVVGPGALGLFYASRLARVTPTALIARNATRARELARGVRVGNERVRLDVFHPGALPKADWAIVLVKGPQTAEAVRIARRLGAKRMLSLQNGIVSGIPQGVTTAAAWREGATVTPVTAGETLLPPGFAPLGALLRTAGFPVRQPRDIERARRMKLLANVCINPVTALFGIRNGESTQRRHAVFTRALAREAAAVLGIPPGRAWRHVADVAARTAGNRSSMLQDVLAGRATEIEQLNGALLRLARRRGVPAPTHAAFRELVRNFPHPKRL